MEKWRLRRLPASRRCDSLEAVINYRSRRCDFPFFRLPFWTTPTSESVTDKRLTLVLPVLAGDLSCTAPADPVSFDQCVFKAPCPIFLRMSPSLVSAAQTCVFFFFDFSTIQRCAVQFAPLRVSSAFCFMKPFHPLKISFSSSHPVCSEANCSLGRRPTAARPRTGSSSQNPTRHWTRPCCRTHGYVFLKGLWTTPHRPKFVEHLSPLCQSTPDLCLCGARAVERHPTPPRLVPN